MRQVVFRVGSERYALPLAAVRAVVLPGPVSRAPRAPPAVRGIMNLRGRVVTVVDLECLLRGGTPAESPGKVLLLDRGRRDLGLLVTEVEGILPPAEGASAGTSPDPADPPRVLDPAELEQRLAALF